MNLPVKLNNKVLKGEKSRNEQRSTANNTYTNIVTSKCFYINMVDKSLNLQHTLPSIRHMQVARTIENNNFSIPSLKSPRLEVYY
jgi:hypothetical protein